MLRTFYETGIPTAILSGDEIIDQEDLARFTARLTTAFEIDFNSPETTRYDKAKMTFDLCTERGMTKKEFSERLGQFLAKQIYPNWKPAEFLEFERTVLMPYSWVKTELIKDDTAMSRMEGWAFEYNGEKWEGWRYTDGTELKIEAKFNPKKIFPNSYRAVAAKKEEYPEGEKYGFNRDEAEAARKHFELITQIGEKDDAIKALTDKIKAAEDKISSLNAILGLKNDQIDLLEKELYTLKMSLWEDDEEDGPTTKTVKVVTDERTCYKCGQKFEQSKSQGLNAEFILNNHKKDICRGCNETKNEADEFLESL
jgi:hypothetical protein